MILLRILVLHCFIILFTFICNSSGVRFPSYGIGLPIYVTNFTGKPPKIGTRGSFVLAYIFSHILLPQLTALNDSLRFFVKNGIIF